MSLLRWYGIYHGRKEWHLSQGMSIRKAILAAHKDANEVFGKVFSNGK